MNILVFTFLFTSFIDGPTMPMKNAIQEIGKHTNMMPRESGITLPMVEIENGSVIVGASSIIRI